MSTLILTLITFLLNFDCIRSTADGNLAQGKQAKQSSNYSSSGYFAGNAVDGDFKGSDFSHTELKANQWWMVDLGKSYNVTNIELYNRDSKESVRLQKVYILTSISPQPPDPNPNSSEWRVRYYHDLPYGALGNIILEGVLVQHVAVFCAHDQGVTLAEVKVYSYRNLAYKAKASQSTTYENYSATIAVDGILFGDKAFSHTDGTSSWWMVDLGKQQPVALVELYSRTDAEFQRFQQMSLWSSTSETPELIPNEWTLLSTHNGTGNYNPVEVFTHNPDQPIRHLRVTTKHKEDIITLKEVQVFSFPRHNHAFEKPTTQKGTYEDSETQYGSSIAVNGDSTAGVFSHTKKGKNNWWKVDLGKSIIFQYAKIYPRSGKGCRNDKEQIVECADRMADTTYLTNHKNSSQAPKKDTNGWKMCMWIKDPLGAEFTITCQDGRTPYTRQFAIVGGNKHGVALTEVEVYGYNQPLMKQDSIQKNNCNNRYVEITFPKWTDIEKKKPWIYNTLPDSLNKLRYTLSIDGHDPINSSSETNSSVSFQWPKERIARSVGRFEISCLTDEGVCPGPVTFGTVKKARVCTEKIENITYERGPIPLFGGNGKKLYNYTITWQEPTTDYDILHPTQPYIYNINSETEMYTKNAWVSVKLEAATNARFKVKAKTVDDFTSEATSIEIQTPSAAPGPPLNSTMQTVDKSCVSLSWKKPTYSNGKITNYQYKCNKEGWHNVSVIKILKTSICKQSPYTNVTCTVRAINDATEPGDESLPASAFTACAPPSSPGNLSLQTIGDAIKEEIGLRKWNYSVSWQEPASKNCKNISLYAVKADHILSQNVTNRSTILTLNAGVAVNVTITARNIAGWSQPLTKQLLTDPAASSKPMDLKLTASTKERCISFTWKEPDFPNGIITGYQTKCTDKDQWSQHHDSTSAEICGYSAYQLVNCTVRAYTKATNSGDESTAVSARTLCEAPDITEDALTYNNSVMGNVGNLRRKIELFVDKEKITPNCYNYTIKYKQLGQRFKNESELKCEFTDLDAVTTYQFEVVIINNQGLNTSKRVDVTTGPLEPKDPPSFLLRSNRSCVTVDNLKDPNNPNGIILHFQVTCTQGGASSKSQTVKKPDNKALICGLQSGSKVTCEVTANNSNYASPAKNDSIYTKVEVIKQPEMKKKSETAATATLLIEPVQLSVDIESYLIIVVIVEQRQKRALPNGICKGKYADCKTALNNNEMSYITGEIPASDVGADGLEFTVGDGSQKGSYTNTKLEVGKDYEIRQAVTYKIDDELQVQVLDTVIHFEPKKQVVEGNNTPTAAIAGGVSALVVLAAIGIFIFLYRKRRAQTLAEKDRRGEISLTPVSSLKATDTTVKEQKVSAVAAVAATPKPSVSSVKKPAKTEAAVSSGSGETSGDSSPYDNFSTDSEFTIPIGELEEFISSQGRAINSQFEKLEALPKPTMDVALLAENKGKSRYKGLYPADSHRVKLKPDHASPKRSTDYINASYIQGYKKEITYIAAQGPTETTVDDFWLMIWQQGISVIVMVTGAIEYGRIKCVQYWPDNPGSVMKFRDIEVSQAPPEVWADFTIRIFQVKKGTETRSIKHFNYVTWPDHGVPKDMGPYVAFFSKIQAFTLRQKDSTRLVHCSAGVGRTGTYIAMDTLLRQVAKEQAINAFGFVKSMRERRPCMIQTVDQYHFLHQAIIEFLTTSHYVCPAASLDSKLSGRKPEHDIIAEEFLHIEKRVEQATFDCSVGKDPDNREKNRFSEILPATHSILYLNGGTDSYINAVLADAHRDRNHWVATQLPLSNTVHHFWRMICEQSISVIAQLEGAQVPFYPRKDGERLVAGAYTLFRCSTEQSGQTMEVSLQVELENVAAVPVQIVVASGWMTDIPSTETIIQLQSILERKQQQTGNNKVCVTCNNGATRCGSFITSMNAIEKLKAEQEVDVYNPVMMAKHRRPQFIPSFEQYEFIYQVMRDYTESFSDYANFR